MRIVAGEFRGRALTPVGKGDQGAHLRPTPDRVREALFSMLASRGAVAGARVLDLFAGTGAMGLEALSRGAAMARFVESGRVGAGLIAKNIALLGVQERAALIRRDALKPGTWEEAPFDLVFLDPPYGKGMGERALVAALAGGWIAPGALIVWEESAPMAAPEGVSVIETRRYGDTHVTLLEAG